jgi:hypothetical protein
MSRKRKRKGNQIQEFAYRDATKVEHEIYEYTGNSLGHRNGNKRFKERVEAIPGKQSIDLLQKTAILGTPHIIRNVLHSEISET